MTATTPQVESLGEPRSEAPGTALWLLIIVMVLAVAPLIVLSQIIAYWRTDVVDDQMFGYYGWRILHGARIYLDVWDNKPPGIYWINALGMLVGGGSYLGVIAMCVVALVAAHAAFFVTAASVYHKGAAALGTILLAFYLTHAYFTGGTNRTETFLVALELGAMALYMRGWARDRWWTWYLAGVLCGGAFLFKQVGLAAWGAMGLHTLILMGTGELPRRTGLRRGVLLAGGAATTVALAALALARQGALGEAIFATFTFNQAYFAHGPSRFPYSFVNWKLVKEHVWPLLLLPLLMALAGGIHALLWWLRPQYRPPEIEEPLKALRPVCPRHYLLFAIWFVAAFWGSLISPHAFRHYVVPAIPPLVLLATYLINVLRAEARLLRRLQQRAWVVVAFVLIAYFGADAIRFEFAEVSKVWGPRAEPWLLAHGWLPKDTPGVERFQPASWEAVGDEVARLTRPDDRIQCWAYLPGVYLRARRINACRFTTLEKIGQVKEGARFIEDELRDCLTAAPPAALVIPAGDYFWMYRPPPATATATAATATEPGDAFHFGPWILAHYRLAAEVVNSSDTFYVFKRKDLWSPAPGEDLDARLDFIHEQIPGDRQRRGLRK